MNKSFKLISRLFRKNPNNSFISDLHSKMTQPLFVHPELGEAVIKSYLTAFEMRSGDESDIGSDFVTRHNNLAVIDISGALTAREESAPCSMPPASYEVIKQEMAELLADDSITTIIGRFDSPGGMASQNMDLSDFIYASRGQGTKMIAMVDDMAYSAAYGIASAFDEICVTRTSGVGSVGVVSYHVDQSEANKRAGIKIEYIFAGDKKVLGNPHESLSEEGRTIYQAEVSRLYNIFTATVARNLGLSVDAVKATQAGTFHGEDAIAAGFAHKLCTFDELLSSVVNAQVEIQTAVAVPMKLTSQENIDKVLQVETTQESTDAVAKVLQVKSIKEPDTVDTGKEPESKENVKTDQDGDSIAKDVAEVEADQVVNADINDKQIEYEAGIRALCAAAGVENVVADEFITSKMALDEVRENLLLLTITNANIINSKSVVISEDSAKAVKSSWDSAFDKV